jgi:hypothetical protein
MVGKRSTHGGNEKCTVNLKGRDHFRDLEDGSRFNRIRPMAQSSCSIKADIIFNADATGQIIQTCDSRHSLKSWQCSLISVAFTGSECLQTIH